MSNYAELIEQIEKLVAKNADSATEKHVPFIEETKDGYLVKVGETTAHPMGEDHWIQYIELTVDDKLTHRVKLNPGDKPEFEFKVAKGKKVVAREYCNLHDLWKNS